MRFDDTNPAKEDMEYVRYVRTFLIVLTFFVFFV